MDPEPEREKARPKPADGERSPMLAPIAENGSAQEPAENGRLGILPIALLAAGVATAVVFKNEIMEAPLFRPPGATRSEATDLSRVRFDVSAPAAAAQVRGRAADYAASYPAGNPTLFELTLLPPALGAAAAGYKASPAAHGTFNPDAPAQTVQMLGFNEGQYVYEIANNSGRAWSGHLTFPASGETWDVRILSGGTVRIQTASVIDDFHPLVGYLTR